MATCLSCLGDEGGQNAHRPHRVDVSVAVNKHVYRPLEPIHLVFTAINVGDKDVFYSSLSVPYERFDVVVRRYDTLGKEVEVGRTAYYIHEVEAAPIISYPRGPWAPGSKWVQSFDANLLYDMTLPGRYSITIEVPYWKEEPEAVAGLVDPLQKFVSRSKPIIVEVDRIRE